MIWVRRLLAIPLSLLFMWLLIGGLLLIHLEGSLLSPEFHKEQLEKADVYNFILEDLPRAAIDELRENYAAQTDADLGDDTLADVVFPVILDDVPASLTKVIPPSWLQEQVEQFLDQVGGYMAGKRDDFEINVPLRDRATALSQEVRLLIPYATLYDHVMDDLVKPGIDEALQDNNAAPLNAPIDAEDVAGSIERAFPKEWVGGQADAALEEATAYLVGDKGTLEIKIALDDRSHAALAEVKLLLQKADDFQIVFDGVINPVLDENVPETIHLPLDVTVTGEEVKLAFLDSVPPGWLKEQALAVVDAAGPYVIGETDTFQVTIPIAERKSNANEVIAALARIKLGGILDELPECEGGLPSLRLEDISQDGLPQCVPASMTLDMLTGFLVSQLEFVDLDEILGGFGYAIPDNIVFTQDDMRESLADAGGEDALESLDYVREVFSEGWSYTDADLRSDLMSSGGSGDVEALDDLRTSLRDGWTFTDADLRRSLRESGGEEAVSELDRIRDMLSRAWLARLVIFLLWIILLLAIGFLGGRQWWSRLAWASAVLSISAAIATITYTVILDAVVPGLVTSLREEALRDANPGPTMALVVDKASATVQLVADSFLGGKVRSSSVALVIVGVIAFLGSLVLRRLSLR